MIFYTERLTAALADRFTDEDEIVDVANYGCSGGVSGFIYYNQTNEFFDDFEDDIEDVCFDILGDGYLAQLAECEDSIQGLKNKMVWFVVQAYCSRIVDILEEVDNASAA